jgi:hypothetical protein
VIFGNGSGYGKLAAILVSRPALSVSILIFHRGLDAISWVTSQSDASVIFGNGSGYGKLAAILVSRPALSVIILIFYRGIT